MRWKKFLGFASLFIIFCVLFGVPYYVQSDQTAQDSQMQEMAVATDSRMMAPPEQEEDFDWAPLISVVLLSTLGTMLSWAMMDKVIEDKEDVVLLSFADDSGKKVMDALSNETCRKILKELSKEELTASQLSEKMDMSIQRIHYNLKKLEETRLVESDSFKYSSRGKEMDVYKLSKKYFVLGPE